MKRLLFVITALSILGLPLYPQCGSMAFNPMTHKLDCIGTPGGGGTVTSLSFPTIPSWLTATVATATTTPAISVTPTAAQTGHQVIGTCGAATTFGPCNLVAADLPTIPAAGVSGLAASATTDTTVATNISTGTLGAGRLPAVAVQTGQANTYTTGDQNMSSATSHEVPVAAGGCPTVNGGIAYDTTQGRTCIGGGTGTAATGSVPKVLSVQHSSTDKICGLHTDSGCSNNVTDGTTEAAFATQYTIPANYFMNNKVLRVTAVFDFTTSAATAPTQRLRLRLGGLAGTVMYDSTAFAPGGSQVSRTGAFVTTLIGTAAAGASVGVETGVLGSANPTNVITVNNTIAQPVLVATNAQQVLAFTIIYGANTTGNATVLRSLIVEELN